MKYPGAKPINDVSFGMATDHRVATLFVAWKGDNPEFLTQELDSFFLKRQEDFIRLRKIMKNILDWGANERLKEIQDALDFLAKAKQKGICGSQIQNSNQGFCGL